MNTFFLSVFALLIFKSGGKHACHDSSINPYIFRARTSTGAQVAITDDHLRRACSGMEVNVVDEPGFVAAIANRSRWSKWFQAPEVNEVPSQAHINECMNYERRRSESITIGTAKKVAVIGGIRHRMVIDASNCIDLSNEADRLGFHGQFAESAFVAFNPAGVAYFHTMYDTLGTLAFGLEEIHATKSKVVLNTCIDAHDVHKLDYGEDWRNVCVAQKYVRELLLAVGIESDQIIEFPFRDPKHDTLFLGEARAVIETSFEPHMRGDYFRPIGVRARSLLVVLKLREVMFRHLNIAEEEITPSSPYILLVDRNDTSLLWHKISNYKDDLEFDSNRVVGNLHQIAAALRIEFPEYRIQIHAPPYGTVREQAILYGGAAAIVGPHGAAESNFIFCRGRVPVIEFVPILNPNYRNSPLYIGLARDLDLQYWAVPVFTLRVISPSLVVRTLRAALFHILVPGRTNATRIAPATAVVTFTSALLLR